jgi:hypothetical protein
MSAPSFTIPHSNPALAAAKKKRVLLVDSSRTKRDLRSETMRKLGVEVDCAADVPEARCWWRADLYDLVLIHVDDAPGPVEKFCNELRGAKPPQQIMFLVGGPEYLAASPSGQMLLEPEAVMGPVSSKAADFESAMNVNNAKPQRWGILEACRQISAIRSVCDARTRAIRDRPAPLRDPETSRPNRTNGTTLPELIREELQ